jgi:hypothetical protein
MSNADLISPEFLTKDADKVANQLRTWRGFVDRELKDPTFSVGIPVKVDKIAEGSLSPKETEQVKPSMHLKKLQDECVARVRGGTLDYLQQGRIVTDAIADYRMLESEKEKYPDRKAVEARLDAIKVFLNELERTENLNDGLRVQLLGFSLETSSPGDGLSLPNPEPKETREMRDRLYKVEGGVLEALRENDEAKCTDAVKKLQRIRGEMDCDKFNPKQIALIAEWAVNFCIQHVPKEYEFYMENNDNPVRHKLIGQTLLLMIIDLKSKGLLTEQQKRTLMKQITYFEKNWGTPEQKKSDATVAPIEVPTEHSFPSLVAGAQSTVGLPQVACVEPKHEEEEEKPKMQGVTITRVLSHPRYLDLPGMEIEVTSAELGLPWPKQVDVQETQPPKEGVPLVATGDIPAFGIKTPQIITARFTHGGQMNYVGFVENEDEDRVIKVTQSGQDNLKGLYRGFSQKARLSCLQLFDPALDDYFPKIFMTGAITSEEDFNALAKKSGQPVQVTLSPARGGLRETHLAMVVEKVSKDTGYEPLNELCTAIYATETPDEKREELLDRSLRALCAQCRMAVLLKTHGLYLRDIDGKAGDIYVPQKGAKNSKPIRILDPELIVPLEKTAEERAKTFVDTGVTHAFFPFSITKDVSSEKIPRAIVENPQFKLLLDLELRARLSLLPTQDRERLGIPAENLLTPEMIVDIITRQDGGVSLDDFSKMVALIDRLKEDDRVKSKGAVYQEETGAPFRLSKSNPGNLDWMTLWTGSGLKDYVGFEVRREVLNADRTRTETVAVDSLAYSVGEARRKLQDPEEILWAVERRVVRHCSGILEALHTKHHLSDSLFTEGEANAWLLGDIWLYLKHRGDPRYPFNRANLIELQTAAREIVAGVVDGGGDTKTIPMLFFDIVDEKPDDFPL